MATDDKLNRLKQTKADLKAALTEKGQNPGNVFSQYPDMVRAIQTGGEQATPVIEVSNGGLITATAGDKSATKQLSTQGGKTITPGPTEQIAVAAGKYVTGDVIVAAVENTGGGGGGGPLCKVAVESQDPHVVNVPVTISARVSVTAEKYYTHFLYNGVRLPRIPESVLASYPYAFIGLVQSTGKYQILASKDPMYFDNVRMKRQNSDSEPYLNCVAGDASWTTGTSGNYSWSIDADRILIWSNHDIPNGSATATDIYFEGTDPVPTD